MTEKKLNILYGLNWQQGADKVANILQTNGFTVTSTTRLSKATIKAYIEDHPEVTTVVLKESVGDGTYGADEIAELTDNSDVNVIIILNSRHKGQPFMQTLYMAGVTCAIFESKKVVTPFDVAKLMMKKRSRAEARAYYDIVNEPINMNILSPFEYQTNMARLEDREYGARLIERFLNVANKLRPALLEDFIKKLPSDYIEELKGYKEFYDVCESLKAYGITPPYKMPRGSMRKALTTVSYDDIPSDVSESTTATTVNANTTSNAGNGGYDAFFEDIDADAPVIEEPANQDIASTSSDNEAFGNFIDDAETSSEEISDTAEDDVIDLTAVGEEEASSNKKNKKQKKSKEKAKKEDKKEGSGKVAVVTVLGSVLLLLAACGATYEIVNMIQGHKSKIEAVSTDEVVAEDSTDESVSDDVASTDEGEIQDASTEETDDASVTDTAYTSTPTSDSIDSETGLLTADENANDQYSNEPESVSTNYSGNVLFDGLTVSGIEVVNIINANPTTRFTVTNPFTNEVTVYTSGGASLADIPESFTYNLTAVDGAYIFSLVEEQQ